MPAPRVAFLPPIGPLAVAISLRWSPTTRGWGRLEGVGQPLLHLMLERSTIDRECQPLAECHGAICAAEQASRQHHGLAHTAPQLKMERPNQRNTHHPGPRDASGDPA